VDPRPETTSSGDTKIVITPQLVHDIFEEFPVVATAYSENVPAEVRYSPSAAQIWLSFQLSSPRLLSGNATSNLSCSIAIKLQLDLLQPNTSLKRTLYLTSICARQMTVRRPTPSLARLTALPRHRASKPTRRGGYENDRSPCYEGRSPRGRNFVASALRRCFSDGCLDR
jgi:hypothetical protein